MRLRTSSISFRSSAKLLIVGFTGIYPVLKALLAIVLLIGKKSADPCASPTEDGNNKGDLSFTAWIDKITIVDGPERLRELDQLFLVEQMLRLLLIHDQPFMGQRMPYLLVEFCSVRTSNIRLGCTHIVHSTPIFLFDAIVRHPSKSSKKPLGKYIH